MSREKDPGLDGNEKIEKYIQMLQEDPSPEVLSAALTAVRRRMKEGGEFVVAVKNSNGNTGTLSAKGSGSTLMLEAVEADGGKWFAAFTGFEEELQGDRTVMSMFKAGIEQIFNMALSEPDVQGVILNPWRRTLKLDKHLIHIVMGK